METLVDRFFKNLSPKVIRCPYRNFRVILTPTKVMFYEDGIGIAWSCSYGEDCDSTVCRYSRKWKELHKDKR